MSKHTDSSKLRETCLALLLHKNQDESVEHPIVNILSFANKQQLQKDRQFSGFTRFTSQFAHWFVSWDLHPGLLKHWTHLCGVQKLTSSLGPVRQTLSLLFFHGENADDPDFIKSGTMAFVVLELFDLDCGPLWIYWNSNLKYWCVWYTCWGGGEESGKF